MGQSLENLLNDAAGSGSSMYLRIGNGSPVGELWTRDGRIIAASIPDGDSRLGARLLSIGQLRESDLKEAQNDAAQGASLSHALEGRVRRELLATIATEEARFVLTRALDAAEHELTSRIDDPPDGLVQISIDIASALAEAAAVAEHIHEAERIAPQNARPSLVELPGMAEGLTAEAWAVVDRCNGINTVAEIGAMCGLTPEASSLIVSNLCASGFLAIEAEPQEIDWNAAEDLEALSQLFTDSAQDVVTDSVEPLDSEIVIEMEPLEELQSTVTFEVEQEVNSETEIAVDAAPAELQTSMNEAPPATVAPEKVTLGVDTASLLRELSSIARDHGKS
ncbi:MAG: hypothetical protein ACYDCC_14900 [Actinomycetota bacterium]